MKQSIASNIKHGSILFLLFFFCFYANAQDSSKKFRNIIFKTRVYNMNEEMIAQGYLVQVNDSNVAISVAPLPYGVSPKSSLEQYNYHDIKYVEYKRKGSIGRGILIGSITSVLLGTIMGLVEGDTKPPEDNNWGNTLAYSLGPVTTGEKVVTYGLGLGLMGGLTGAIIGAISNVVTKKFTINGKPSALKELNTTLLERVYSK